MSSSLKEVLVSSDSYQLQQLDNWRGICITAQGNCTGQFMAFLCGLGIQKKRSKYLSQYPTKQNNLTHHHDLHQLPFSK
jgi:hypothetical protein